jgi:hypothetical protein
MFLKAVSVLGIVALAVVVVVQLVAVVVVQRLWVLNMMLSGRLVAPRLEYNGLPPRQSTPWITIQPPTRNRLDWPRI